MDAFDFTRLLSALEDKWLDDRKLGSALWSGGDPADFIDDSPNWRGLVTSPRQTMPTLAQVQQEEKEASGQGT